MMKLKSVQIENFRSIKDARLNIESDFLAMVGENNCGKTNIIQAIDFFFAKPPTAPEFKEIVNDQDVRKTISVICTFSKLTERDKEMLKKYVINDLVVVKRTSHIEDGKVLSVVHGALEMNDDSNIKWSDTEFEGFRATNQRSMPQLLHIPAIRDVTEETKNKTDYFGQIISAILQSIPEDQLKELDDLNQKVSRMMNYDGQGEDSRLKGIRYLESDFLDFVRPYMAGIKMKLDFPVPDFKSTNVPKILINDGILGPPSSKGHGLQSVLFFSIIRLYEKYLINSDPEKRRSMIFAIDEPEIYLHPSMQRTMFKILQEISRLDQVIISTHSPHFVDVSNYETVAKVSRSLELGTSIKQAPRDLISSDRKRRLEVFAKFNSERNEIFFAGKIIFVEGDGDRFAILSSSEMLEKKFDSLGVIVAESGGKGNIPDYVKIADAFGIPFYVAYDSDSDKKEAQKDSSAIEATLTKSANFKGKVIFEPRLEVELGLLDRHLTPPEVLEHFEKLSKESIPEKIRSFVETVSAS
jgi:putative ATP-dependent endonuclease of OLD family